MAWLLLLFELLTAHAIGRNLNSKSKRNNFEKLWTFPEGPGASGPPGAGQSDCDVYYGIDNAAPAFDSDRVYFASNHQGWYLYALEASTGQQIWKASYGVVTAPAVGDKGVYFGAIQSDKARVVSIDKFTGKTIWDVEAVGSTVHAPPVVADDMVFIVLHEGLMVFNASTGKALWNASKYTSCSNTSPQVADGVVFVAGGYGKNGIVALDAASGKLLWTTLTDIQNPWASPVIYDNMVFISGFKTNYHTGTVYGVSKITGSIRWYQNLTALGQKTNPLYTPYAPLAPAVANGRLFVGGAMGTLYALNTSTGGKIWDSDQAISDDNTKYMCEGHLWMVPAAASGLVFAGCDAGNLYALDDTTGTIRWTYTTAGHAVYSPVVINDTVLFGVENTFERDGDDNFVVLEF